MFRKIYVDLKNKIKVSLFGSLTLAFSVKSLLSDQHFKNTFLFAEIKPTFDV